MSWIIVYDQAIFSFKIERFNDFTAYLAHVFCLSSWCDEQVILSFEISFLLEIKPDYTVRTKDGRSDTWQQKNISDKKWRNRFCNCIKLFLAYDNFNTGLNAGSCVKCAWRPVCTSMHKSAWMKHFSELLITAFSIFGIYFNYRTGKKLLSSELIGMLCLILAWVLIIEHVCM